jgi:hypothetical protein
LTTINGLTHLDEHSGIKRHSTSSRLNPDEFHYLYLIEANYRLPIDDRHRRALIAHIDQLFQR